MTYRVAFITQGFSKEDSDLVKRAFDSNLVISGLNDLKEVRSKLANFNPVEGVNATCMGYESHHYEITNKKKSLLGRAYDIHYTKHVNGEGILCVHGISKEDVASALEILGLKEYKEMIPK